MSRSLKYDSIFLDHKHIAIAIYTRKNGSHYRASELIESFQKLNREEGGQNNNRPINLPKVI